MRLINSLTIYKANRGHERSGRICLRVLCVPPSRHVDNLSKINEWKDWVGCGRRAVKNRPRFRINFLSLAIYLWRLGGTWRPGAEI